MTHNYHTIVLSGGGIKGITYIGAFKKLDELQKENKIQLEIKTLCTVSAGTIFGFLYILGYTWQEMETELVQTNFQKLKSTNITFFLKNYGIDSGKKIIKWLKQLMIKKNFNKNCTFQDLYKQTGIDLQMMVTNLNRYKYQKLNYQTVPEMNVLEAIRMSISFPFAFSAIQNKDGDYCVDGCIINNYPIDQFEDISQGVLGLRIINYGNLEAEDIQHKIEDIGKYVTSIFHCYFFSKEKLEKSSSIINKCTVYINCNINSLDFSLKDDEKQNLINIGYNSVLDFFKNL